MREDEKRERRQTQLELALDDDKPSGERHSTEAQRGRCRQGRMERLDRG